MKVSIPLMYTGLQLITKTRLFKYIEYFTSKHWKFSNKKKTLIFFIFLLKTQIVGTR